MLLVVWPSATKFPFRKEEKEKKNQTEQIQFKFTLLLLRLKAVNCTSVKHRKHRYKFKRQKRVPWLPLTPGSAAKAVDFGSKELKTVRQQQNRRTIFYRKKCRCVVTFLKNTKALLFLFWLRVQHTAAAVLHWIEHFWYDILIESLSLHFTNVTAASKSPSCTQMHLCGGMMRSITLGLPMITTHTFWMCGGTEHTEEEAAKTNKT